MTLFGPPFWGSKSDKKGGIIGSGLGFWSFLDPKKGQKRGQKPVFGGFAKTRKVLSYLPRFFDQTVQQKGSILGCFWGCFWTPFSPQTMKKKGVFGGFGWFFCPHAATGSGFWSFFGQEPGTSDFDQKGPFLALFWVVFGTLFRDNCRAFGSKNPFWDKILRVCVENVTFSRSHGRRAINTIKGVVSKPPFLLDFAAHRPPQNGLFWTPQKGPKCPFWRFLVRNRFRHPVLGVFWLGGPPETPPKVPKGVGILRVCVENVTFSRSHGRRAINI